MNADRRTTDATISDDALASSAPMDTEGRVGAGSATNDAGTQGMTSEHGAARYPDPATDGDGDARPAMTEQPPVGESTGQSTGTLLPGTEASHFRSRWTEIQATFVDDPRTAVVHADGLVLELTGRLAQLFSEERGRLEDQWARGADTETEQLRVALQHYRGFFEALLRR